MTTYEAYKLKEKQKEKGLDKDELLSLNHSLENDKAFISNELLQALFHRSSNFTALQLLIFIASRDEANTFKNGDYYTIRFDLEYFQEAHSTPKSTLYTHLDNIQKTVITFFKDGDWAEKISLIARQKKITRSIIEVDMHEKIYTMIKNKSANFSVLNALDFRNKISFNTIRVLFLLHKINNQEIKRKLFTIDELNFMFDTNYSSYELVRSVLNKAKKELDQSSSSLSFNILKRDDTEVREAGRPKILGIYIEVIDNQKQKQTNEELRMQKYLEEKKAIYNEHEQQGQLGIV